MDYCLSFVCLCPCRQYKYQATYVSRVTDNSWKMKMKILAAFLLAVLGWSFTEGRIVSKCELRDQLKNATANLTMPNGLTVDNVVATSK